jgi:2-polyprenyl-3-methyl-5-hydroxy-6-metoxy-1,4-benzoquinol methylase
VNQIGFQCKLCYGTEIARSYLLERPRKNSTPFIAVRCKRCGLFQDLYDWRAVSEGQELTQVDPSGRKDGYVDDPEEVKANEAKARLFADFLAEQGLIVGKRVLDVGCRHGFFLRACLDRGASHVAGQEFLYGSVEQAARIGVTDVRTVTFADRAAWPDGEFDTVCSLDVVEHVHDVQTFFRECRRVTRPGGVLFHVTPAADCLPNRLGRALVSGAAFHRRARAIGTSLCNLQPVVSDRGGAHVSILGTGQVHALASLLDMGVRHCSHVANYTHSDEHYASVIPLLNELPRPLATKVFRFLRSRLPNKVMFVTDVPTRADPVNSPRTG